MIVEDIVSQISVLFKTRYNCKDKFWGFMFPQVVQRHLLAEVGYQITVW